MKNSENKSTVKSGYSIVTTVLVLLTLCFCVYNSIQLRRTKIACINSVRVLNAYHDIETLNKKMVEKNKQFQAKLEILSSEFQSALKEFEKNRSRLSNQEIQEAGDKLRKKQEEYEQFNSSNEENIKNEQRELLDKALERVNNKIAQYAKKEGYSAVFGANATGSLVYMNDYVDITEDVVAIINN